MIVLISQSPTSFHIAQVRVPCLVKRPAVRVSLIDSRLSTVFFADIAGFTAWSSTREPAQVFLLLQTLYQNFDLIAKRRRVFKVETIGGFLISLHCTGI